MSFLIWGFILMALTAYVLDCIARRQERKKESEDRQQPSGKV